MKKRFSSFSVALLSISLTLTLIATTATAQKAPEAVDGKQVSPVALVAPAANATTAAAVTPLPEQMAQGDSSEAEALEYTPPLQVGDSATGLLALQREGAAASLTARPIAGEVAMRSYERYLKSFEYPIPERFNSTVKTKSDSGR